MRHTGRLGAATAAVITAVLLTLAPASPLVPSARAEDPSPTVATSPPQAAPGGDITVTGQGWKHRTLLTLLLCGQNAIGGTNSCANATGRAVTTDDQGGFSKELPVAAPPKPCPCVVRVSTVLGESMVADAPFVVTGHPVAPLPQQAGGGRLAVLTARLEGSGGLLTWFGAPPRRRLVFTVGNLGSDPARDPVFRIGTSHGVFAPQWDEQRWRGTVAPGTKQRIGFPVELAAGAHGDYTVSLQYGDRILVTEPWSVGRPWGVTLFWTLLFVVVPAAVFRIGMAVVDRVRPRPAGSAARPRPRLRARGRARSRPGTRPRHRAGAGADGPATSAPTDDRPTPKGSS